MTTDRETAEVIRSWMKEEVRLDDAGIQRVLARLPDTLQRQHRWLWPLDWRPFASGATRSADAHWTRPTDHQPVSIAAATGRLFTATGRTRPMFNPVKAIIAASLVFALGGVLFVARPLGPQERLVPGAEPMRLEGSRVTVAQDCPAMQTEPAVCTWASSDPRLTGTLTYEIAGDIISVAGDDGDFFWTDATVEGADGGWTGRLYISITDPPVGFAVLSGSGALEGWQYVATEVGGDGVHDEWSGIVYEGELPPFGPPTVPASE